MLNGRVLEGGSTFSPPQRVGWLILVQPSEQYTRSVSPDVVLMRIKVTIEQNEWNY